ncbi:iron-sulfur cluster insertion protein ErpA [Reinekea marinisedimentorum]|uniref:Iron-sulfur cluster insertion protein ErpA n=1 Tax=Reinekea marinisedimentorum TaxID=230495 RepID=A0A4R3HT49_9GAMM|nr:iron-sulfur cluster insertion protein ErpA [Reinekea marinisedimentorum]TCS36148.1 iron-sulfur cluster insertion protein [Reinekea marinisedimentorum]
MTDAVIEVADPINITEAAVLKVKQLVEEEDNSELMLRVFVTGGGCAGFQYGFTFDDDIADDDSLISKEGVRFVIDSLSVQYLGGSTVDYTEGLDGSRFIIQNPAATTTCGCGSSFAI